MGSVGGFLSLLHDQKLDVCSSRPCQDPPCVWLCKGSPFWPCLSPVPHCVMSSRFTFQNHFSPAGSAGLCVGRLLWSLHPKFPVLLSFLSFYSGGLSSMPFSIVRSRRNLFHGLLLFLNLGLCLWSPHPASLGRKDSVTEKDSRVWMVQMERWTSDSCSNLRQDVMDLWIGPNSLLTDVTCPMIRWLGLVAPD